MLIELLAIYQEHLAQQDPELAVNRWLGKLSRELANYDRFEIRGFGSFSLHLRSARIGRNPKSGDEVGFCSKFMLYFKPVKELGERVKLNNISTKITDLNSNPAATLISGAAPDPFLADEIARAPRSDIKLMLYSLSIKKCSYLAITSQWLWTGNLGGNR